MAKSRIEELDTLRGLAFVAVVLQHAIGIFDARGGNGLYYKWASAFLFMAAKFAVPAFLFISGMVLFYNYYDKFDFVLFMRKRMLEVIIPYAICSLLFTIFYLQSAPVTEYFYKSFFLNTLTGSVGYHLWFILVIIQFYLTFPFWRLAFLWVERHLFSQGSKVILLLAIAIIYAGITYLARSLHAGNATGIVRWLIFNYDRTFLLWFFYFILGGVVSFNLDKWKTFVSKTFLPCLAVVSGFCIYLSYFMVQGSPGLDLSYATSLKPSMVVFSVCAIVVVYKISEQLKTKTDLFDLLGKYSFGAYLLHTLVLDICSRVIIRYAAVIGRTLQLMLIVALTAGIACLITIIISRLPGISIIVGRIKQ
jgi:peptidoglycan/LPS O-acetylase OafA/YrhL